MLGRLFVINPDTSIARHCCSWKQVLVGATIGLSLGVLLSAWSRQSYDLQLALDCQPEVINKKIPFLPDDIHDATAKQRVPEKGFIFIGIMTAQKYLDSRAVAIYNTWGKSINGKLMFFTSEGSTSNYDIPIVSLTNVDDSYPPQKKAFMLLKYMHDRHVDDFEWFMRADDDCFVKWDKLERFLRSINSSKPQLIGHAGFGNKEEFGLLSLGENENFCMGGPGVILSQEAMRRVGPHLGLCVHNLLTWHEDVEIGRCVQAFTGVPCTMAYEMADLFFQNYKASQGSFLNELNDKAVERATTLHPIKDPSQLFHVQNHIKSLQISDLRQKEMRLQREIYEMDQRLSDHVSNQSDPRYMHQSFNSKYEPMAEKDIAMWEFITESSHFSYHYLNTKKHLQEDTKVLVDGVIDDVNFATEKHSKQTGSARKLEKLLYGYIKSDPLHGADYALDLRLTFQDGKQKRVKAAVRRRLMEAEVIESPLTSTESLELTKSSHIFRHLHGADLGVEKLKETVHFVQCLVGKVTQFDRFMKVFESICLEKQENVVLHIVLFSEQSSPEDVQEIRRTVWFYEKKYGGDYIDLAETGGEFSRAKALNIGAERCPSDALMFFADVDLLLTSDILVRIRLNTLQGAQVNFPAMFSQYDPDTICADITREECQIRADDFDPKMGNWRYFGYGPAALYRSDFDMVGGFNTSIQGWGKEDVDLFDRFVSSNLTVFRSVDVGVIHAYHDKTCDPGLPKDQLMMCFASKATSFGSIQQLAQMVFSMPDILNQNRSEAIPLP